MSPSCKRLADPRPGGRRGRRRDPRGTQQRSPPHRTPHTPPRAGRRPPAGGALSIIRKSAPPDDLVEAVLAAAEGVTFPTPDWAAALDADEDFVAEHLSDLEAHILAHYASGESSASVARALSVSKNTVNTYIARIRDKYRESGRPAESRVDLFRRAAEDGLVSYYD